MLCLFAAGSCSPAGAQCLSSVTPVGGTENLLVLQKGTFRVIAFYKHGGGDQYFEKSRHADYDLINHAFYNSLTGIMGYGLSDKLTLESELGYFINKTQVYNTQPAYTLRGSGLSNLIISGKYGLLTDHFKRLYLTGAMGIKIPTSREPQMVNKVVLPVELQPTAGSFGLVFHAILVKENTGRGLRFFFTNRTEINFVNKQDYRLGSAMFNSVYVSKHLMFPWVKGDWTVILQVRHEFRMQDRIAGQFKKSSGSTLFFLVPQLNYVLHERWYLSGMVDIPLYQYFNGTQLGAGIGFALSVARSFG